MYARICRTYDTHPIIVYNTTLRWLKELRTTLACNGMFVKPNTYNCIELNISMQ